MAFALFLVPRPSWLDHVMCNKLTEAKFSGLRTRQQWVSSWVACLNPNQLEWFGFEPQLGSFFHPLPGALMSTNKFNAGGYPVMEYHPIQGGRGGEGVTKFF